MKNTFVMFVIILFDKIPYMSAVRSSDTIDVSLVARDGWKAIRAKESEMTQYFGGTIS